MGNQGVSLLSYKRSDMGSNVEKPRPGWLRRHWWLTINVLILGSLYASSVLFGNYGLSLVTRHSREYKLGIDAFRSSTKASTLLGDHLDATGDYPKETKSTIGGDGSSELNIPVSGSIRKGTLYIKASERSGEWYIDELTLRLDGQSNWNDILSNTSR